SDSFRFLISVSLLFIFLWFIFDKFQGKNDVRENKKGALPWLFFFSIIMTLTTILPILISAGGDLTKVKSLSDVGGLFLAILLGVWRVLSFEQRVEPLQKWEKLNPMKIISRLHPYTKALLLLSLSMFAFYESLASSTIAGIFDQIDQTKLMKLNILASLFGLSYVSILIRYRNINSEEPGLLRRILVKVGKK
ncbi:MAG: hypothetical protein ACFFD1_11845, partial [Candidatus Thorarchaeota archaeon]